jgi:hypothetical protein
MKTIIALLLMWPMLASATTLCADPYPATSDVSSAVMKINGVVSGSCSIITKPTGKVPTCTFNPPMVAGAYAISMAACRSATDCSAETSKAYAVTNECKAVDKTNSQIVCVVTFGPSPPEPMPATYCGDAAPADVFIVTGSQAFPLNPNGTRSLVPIAQVPVKGSTCDCTNPIIQVARYCRVQIPGVTVAVVAGCSLKR